MQIDSFWITPRWKTKCSCACEHITQNQQKYNDIEESKNKQLANGNPNEAKIDSKYEHGLDEHGMGIHSTLCICIEVRKYIIETRKTNIGEREYMTKAIDHIYPWNLHIYIYLFCLLNNK